LRAEVTDDTRLAPARERFLMGEPVEPGLVRDTILASWWRCREWHVAAGRVDLSYVRDPDRDTPLARTASCSPAVPHPGSQPGRGLETSASWP
jgi:hypothetical protein